MMMLFATPLNEVTASSELDRARNPAQLRWRRSPDEIRAPIGPGASAADLETWILMWVAYELGLDPFLPADFSIEDPQVVDRDGVRLNPGSKNVREVVSRSLFDAWRSTIDAIDLGSCDLDEGE